MRRTPGGSASDPIAPPTSFSAASDRAFAAPGSRASSASSARVSTSAVSLHTVAFAPDDSTELVNPIVSPCVVVRTVR